MAWRTPPPELTAWVTRQRRPPGTKLGDALWPARRRRLIARRRCVSVRTDAGQLLTRGWIERGRASRAVRVTEAGAPALPDVLGAELERTAA